MKKGIVWIIIAALTLSLSGCSLIAVDPDVDAKITVAKVDGDVVTKGEAIAYYNMMANYYVQLYAMYGMTLDLAADTATATSIKEEALYTLAQRIVLKNQLEAMGLGLTEEEIAAIEAEAQADYEESFIAYRDYYYPDSTLNEESLRAAVVARMEADYNTYEMSYASHYAEAVEEKLHENAMPDVTLTEEDIQTAYDELVAEQMAAYAETPTQFANDYANNSIIAYQPAGYRYVKNLLLYLTEDITERLRAIEDAQYAAENTIYQIENQISALGADASETDIEELEALKATAEQELDDLNAQKEAIIAEGLEILLPKAQEVLALAKGTPATEAPEVEEQAEVAAEGEAAQDDASEAAEGEEATGTPAIPPADFDELIATYGGDDGMTVEPMMTNGYTISADTGTAVYDQAFNDAAMALVAPGDISDLVPTAFGYHILLYMGDVAEGPVELSSIIEMLRERLLHTKQDEAYEALLTSWFEAADIQIWPEQLK